MLMLTMTKLTKHKHLLGLITFLAGLATLLTLGAGQAHAATLTVSSGCTIAIVLALKLAGSGQSPDQYLRPA